MATRAREWMRDNRAAEPGVHFVFPADLDLSEMTVSRAFATGIISANLAGEKLVAAVVRGFPAHEEPMVKMVRSALSVLNDPNIYTTHNTTTQ